MRGIIATFLLMLVCALAIYGCHAAGPGHAMPRRLYWVAEVGR